MRKVAILGYGVSGKAVERYCKKRGDAVVIYEGDGSEPLDMEGVDLVVKSPGISRTHPWVLQAGETTSEIELGLQALAGKRLFGITGSNGKTTTTLMVAHVLEACACGNVGAPLLDQVEEPFDTFVIELSSFQLFSLRAAPYFDAALILNITPNHLDWHTSMEEYVACKLRLVECVKEGGRVWMGREAYEKYGQDLEKVDPINKLRYRDEATDGAAHDWKNIEAAYTLCRLAGIEEALFWERMRTFKKPSHRLEFVCEKGGVRFVNDSKATSVDAVASALRSLAGKAIWIAGGVDKGGSFRALLPLVEERVRIVVALGEAAPRIERELEGGVQIIRAASFEEGVRCAQKEARKGETVLLSPGCASYDEFRNFEERGERFKHYVTSEGER